MCTKIDIELKENKRIIFHEETLFLEYSEKPDNDKFHPKPSAPINKDRKLYVLQIYKVVLRNGSFYQGILYSNRKSFAARIENKDKEVIYHDNMEIISTDYMDEFGVQIGIFLGENKMDVIKKAQQIVRKNK